jgi:hypothetical protein
MKAHRSARFSSRCYRFRNFDVGSYTSIIIAHVAGCLAGSAAVRWLHWPISAWAELQYMWRYDRTTELRIAGEQRLRGKKLLALPYLGPLS